LSDHRGHKRHLTPPRAADGLPALRIPWLLRRLEDLPQVIFTTAYDAYAIKAFEVNALDYLLKPIAPARLAAAVAKVRPTPRRGRLERVFVREGDRCWIVRLPDILLLESEGNYTRVWFGSERPLIRRSLNALEEDLDATMFFRASRKQIVNLKWIEKVDIGVGGGFVATLRGVTASSGLRVATFSDVLGMLQNGSNRAL
jgi:two-component system, LytTR family, response regulator